MNSTIKKAFNNRYLRNRNVRYGLIFLAGILLGWLLFGSRGGHESGDAHGHSHEQAAATVWTCSMHPQIKMEKPGKCPLCAMDLIPLTSSGGGDAVDPDAIRLSGEAIALANIQTTVVSRQNPVKDIQLFGTIQVDERLSQSQTSHVNGRIEKLFVNFTGESLRQGQTIATVYSPELLNAQQELLEAVKMESVQPMLLQAAREKLRLWKLTDEQIAAIEKSGVASPLVEIKSNSGGVVITKNVNQGDYISQGNVLLSVANLSQVWAMFDAYESDLPFLKVGDNIEFSLQAIPGKTFSGKISFIDPLLDKNTRTSKVRVVTSNPGMQLKPEMFASARVTAPLRQHSNQVVIPNSAVLWTGKRSIVYVKQPNAETPAFMLREVDLGPSLGGAYVVLSGLNDGDEIVTNGAFTIDATAQLEGKRSMMNMDVGQKNIDPESTKGEHATLMVQGLCEMCKDRIEKTARGINGVYSAVWELKTRELHLDFDKALTSKAAISKAVAAVGHDTDMHKADNNVYEALPACCKYREQ
ncbi:MAG: efflux RND transporter periplasmic adaptor subunit [Bacteroidia bacterium]|nr:efflux RND transporter periplasmic adaptor subunit [Bacteroidia bacterium]